MTPFLHEACTCVSASIAHQVVGSDTLVKSALHLSYSGREAPSLKIGSVCLFVFVVVVVGVERSRLRSAALITSLFCTGKMVDACLVCLY